MHSPPALQVQQTQLQAAYLALEAAVAAGLPGGCRAARRIAPRLFRDTAAVLSGLRPAFMLDYAQLAPGGLAAAVGAMARALSLARPPLLCVAAAAEGCALLVRPGLLTRAPSPDAPALIAFEPDAMGGMVRPHWEGAEAAQAVLLQLEALRQWLEARAALPPASPPVVDLLDGPAAPVLPTLAGYLLGYPALYLVHDQEGAQCASRALSSAALQLHTVAATLACGAAGGWPAPEDGTLSGFTVPAELASGCDWEARWDAWQRSMLARVEAARQVDGWPWAQLEVHAAAQAPRAVAL